MDFVTDLPPSSGDMVIPTVVDWCSKMLHLIPLTKLPSAKELSSIMVKEIFRLHSLPKDIVSDCGPQFTSKFWGEFCSLLGVSTSLSSGFQPQFDGKMVRANQEVETKLHLLCEGDQQVVRQPSLGGTRN